jgi:hypothetical protein
MIKMLIMIFTDKKVISLLRRIKKRAFSDEKYFFKNLDIKNSSKKYCDIKIEFF